MRSGGRSRESRCLAVRDCMFSSFPLTSSRLMVLWLTTFER